MGNPFETLWNDAKQVTGSALNGGAHLLGDGLNAVGLHGAAQTVDTLGDKAGYDLGADVPELQLGQTSDPAELVHGDPAAIRSSATQLNRFSSSFSETAAGLRGLDTAHWTGSAADAFRAKFAPHPAKWQDASSATGTAFGALESYAGAVQSAQGQARQAVDLYARGQEATTQAQSAYNAQVAAYNSAAQAYNTQLAGGQNPGPPPTEPGPFTDPGEPMRAQAQQILSQARSARDTAAASAAAAIRPATISRRPSPPSCPSWAVISPTRCRWGTWRRSRSRAGSWMARPTSSSSPGPSIRWIRGTRSTRPNTWPGCPAPPRDWPTT